MPLRLKDGGVGADQVIKGYLLKLMGQSSQLLEKTFEQVMPQARCFHHSIGINVRFPLEYFLQKYGSHIHSNVSINAKWAKLNAINGCRMQEIGTKY